MKQHGGRLAKMKRCNFWDDNKKPRRAKGALFGCWRKDESCFFVHPTEKDWDTAELSYPPPAHEVQDNDSDFYYELITSRNRKQGGSSVFSDSHRDCHRHTSPPNSPRVRRPESMGSKRSRSPATSVAESDQLEKLRRDDGDIRRKSTTSSSYSRRRSPPPPLDDRGRRGDRARSPIPTRRLSPPRSQMSITKTPMPPPPPPPSQNLPQPHAPQGTPPTRPPPPVPMPPSFLSLDVSQKPLEKSRLLSADELRKLWHERVDLLFASVKAREQWSIAERDLSLRKLGESSRGVSNTRITAQTRALELQIQAKKTEIFDIMQKLTASDFWPALKSPELQSVEAKFLGMKQQISELRDSVTELSTSFSALLKVKDAGVTSKDSGEPPLKKRKLEGEEAGSSEVTFSLSALDELQERLGGVDRQLSDLQNDVYQRNSIVEEEIESRIDARLEEVDMFPDEDDINLSLAAVTAEVQTETARALEVISVTDQQLGEVVQEVANLILQSKGTDDESTRLRQENEQLKAEIVKLKASAEADAKLVQQNNEEVGALAAALQAFISQAPPQPPQPVIPTNEYLMEELEDDIVSSVSKHIQPLLVIIKDDVSKMIDDESTSMYRTLWPKIELVLRMVDTIAKGSNVSVEPQE
ncbi:uncharacterized protein EDB91DRAFT_34583 [Suillus paluster]|uniref:uncharacterized protein n=1 Tax=Suillus paluster TaxID=48578 RepID=UPI001B86201C|nr:uncharacterized protein EDB91DRAFT_34583 [Suillus paluster]KAG1756755.1 hypothetical protein EDB91DRAFT_34583 [Suillus paluster]